MSVKQNVDRLIDWYVAHGLKPNFVGVNCRPRTLAKFAKKAKRNGPYVYRGFKMLATRETSQRG